MTESCTELDFEQTLKQHGGVFAKGSHSDSYGEESCELCLLEMIAACEVARGLRDTITDSPATLDLPDVRAINDACWSSREAAFGPLNRLRVAILRWRDMTPDQRQLCSGRIAVKTVNYIIADLPGLPAKVRTTCRVASDIAAARAAARAAAAAYAYAAADAADAAYAAAAAAAYADAADAAAAAYAYAAAAAARAATAAAADAAADCVLTVAIDQVFVDSINSVFKD